MKVEMMMMNTKILTDEVLEAASAVVTQSQQSEKNPNAEFFA